MSGYRALTDERGYTLAELLTAMAVMGLLMAGLFLTLQEGQTVYSFGAGRAEVQQNARVALERMLRELRTATQVTAANANGVTFQFLDENSALVTVAYSLSGTSLQRNQTVPTPTATQPETLIGGVNSLALTYFDANNAQLSSPVTASSVYGVQISLTTRTEDTTLANYAPANRQSVMAGRVKLRNE
jgi:prepilin-type N-terminal cleavage/methylation domain-containing protein